MTLTEKLFARKMEVERVSPGEYYLVEVDKALANDITAPVAIEEFVKAGGNRVAFPDRIILVADHFVPCKDILSAQQVQKVRRFATDQQIRHFYDLGRMGIEHVFLPEQGLVKSWEFVVGADSHTCTYGALGAFATGVGSTDIAGVFLIGKIWLKVPDSIRIRLEGRFKPYVSAKDVILKVISMLGVDGANYQALEFEGPALESISMEGRQTISNMAIECGAKAGLFPVDAATQAYELERGYHVESLEADPNAHYSRSLTIDLDQLNPQVAYPFLPSNAKEIGAAEQDRIRIDQAVIGSCTNGRIEDLRAAAAILKDRQVHPQVRCIIFPGSQQVYLQAVREGLVDIFIQAQCAISTPSCGPCLGGHLGILADNEKAISTTNRNFKGRMGHITSQVYLASPAVAAASAVKGIIADPSKL